MVLPDSHRVSRAQRYLGNNRECNVFRLQDYHLLWSTLPGGSAIQSIFYSLTLTYKSRTVPTTPGAQRIRPTRTPGLGCFPFDRLY